MFNDGHLTNVSNTLFQSLEYYFRSAKGTIYIFCPFITNSTIEKLLCRVDNEVYIVTSWREDHLLNGVSSVELYNVCKANGWKLFINNRLHCKIYSDSFNSCIISSANCTESALVLDEGNIESMLLLGELSKENRIELKKILMSSQIVNDDIYEQYKAWFNVNHMDVKVKIPKVSINSYKGDICLLPYTSSPNILWEYMISEDEREDMSIEHDIALYTTCPICKNDYSAFISDVKNCFKSNLMIKLIESNIRIDGTRFGEFRVLLINNCDNLDRSQVDILIRNVYEWFVTLFPSEYKWDVPGSHSQVIYKIKS